MDREVATFVSRAATSRFTLAGLAESIPGGWWSRQAPGDSQSAREHLQEAAVADVLVAELVRRASSGGGATIEVEAGLAAVRDAARDGLAEAGVTGVLRKMRSSREALEGALASLPAEALEVQLEFTAAVDAWGTPLRMTVREYLAAWPLHDRQQEAAIREAIATPPDLSAVLLTRRPRSPRAN